MTTRSSARSVRWAVFTALAVAVASLLVIRADPSSATGSTTPPPQWTGWTGVMESVLGKFGADGAPSGEPSQDMLVTASGSGRVTVGVPATGPPAHPRRGKAPPIVNGVGQFKFAVEPGDTSSQVLKTPFKKELPLEVTPHYELDGHTIEPGDLPDISSKSGDLKVTYKVANTTSATTTVNFTGFTGGQLSQTVTLPIPLWTRLSLSFPADASNISAPGATLTPGSSKVTAIWNLLLAPPLGAATQSISYSVHLTKAQVPDVLILGKVIVPSAEANGRIGDESAAAVASAEAQGKAALGKALAKAQASLQKLHRSNKRLNRTQRHGAGRTLRVGRHGSHQFVTAVKLELAKVKTSVSGIGVEIQDAGAAISNLEAQARELLSRARQDVADVVALEQLVSQSITDLKDLADQGSPEWMQLSDHLAAAEARAKNVVGRTRDRVQRLEALIAAIRDVRRKIVIVTTVAGDAHQLVSAAGRQFSSLLETEVDGQLQMQSGGQLQTQSTSLRRRPTSTAGTQQPGIVVSLDEQVQSLSSQIADAKRHLAAVRRSAQANLQRTVREEKAKSAEKSQANKEKTQQEIASARQKVADANSDYAHVIAFDHIARANRLPGGNASAADVQYGSYLLKISTEGPKKHPLKTLLTILLLALAAQVIVVLALLATGIVRVVRRKPAHT